MPEKTQRDATTQTSQIATALPFWDKNLNVRTDLPLTEVTFSRTSNRSGPVPVPYGWPPKTYYPKLNKITRISSNRVSPGHPKIPDFALYIWKKCLKNRLKFTILHRPCTVVHSCHQFCSQAPDRKMDSP
jgi:hypothetical protein